MTRRPLPAARIRDLPFDPGPGLSEAEAADRRRAFGANDILDTPARPFLDLLKETARDPMIAFLLGTGGLYALLDQNVEALTLLLAVVPLAGMDAYLHHRTRASMEGLRHGTAARAAVLRDGAVQDRPARDLVPGDVVFVREGQPVPADGLLIGGEGIQVDESALTGESFPASKRRLPRLPEGEDEPLVEDGHWLLAGTRLLTGEAAMRVIYTGGETLHGEAVRSARPSGSARTPLQRAIARLVRWLVAAAVALCAAIGAARLAQGHGWADAIVSAVTLATAAIPEEFPVVFTFFLGLGAYRLARRKALVRKAVSVENIGRVTCICSDKTGTITAGRLRLARILPAPPLDEAGLLAVGALASRPGHGDPLDAAILEARGLEGSGVEGSGLSTPERVATFPFTEDRRRETALLRRADGSVLAATKGAPEEILEAADLGDDERQAWRSRVERLSEAGFKVIACASLEAGRNLASDRLEPSRGFRLAGLLGFEDPVRDGVREAIDVCRAAGIHPLMLTGDHPATARAVAAAIGLGGGTPRVVTGDAAATRLARGDLRPASLDVVARATPGDKLRLVRALQAAGEVVAVTGDGVNDAPALAAADVGIAMGARGTRSARESAAIVLMDDSFETIVRAVAEGRQLFDNLRSSFAYLLVVHLPLVLSATLVPLCGFPLLYLPIHIVWLELMIHPAALLAFQEPPRDATARSLRRGRGETFFSPRELLRIGGTGGLIALLVIGGFLRGLGTGVEHGRAAALAALACSATLVLAVLSRLRTRMAWIVGSASLLGSVLLIQVPWLARRLHLEPLHWEDWAAAVAGSLLAVGVPAALEAAASRMRAPTGGAS